MRVALTIAGSDSGGGAGIQADLKTFHQFGVFGTSAITAITAQNTVGVTTWEPVSVQLIQSQIEAVATDLFPSAVKTGMLGNASIVSAVAESISRHALRNYVLDPVMVATSGNLLIERDAVSAICENLVPLAALVTPNADEARVMTGIDLIDHESMQLAAEAITAMGAHAVLIKGGHMHRPESAEVVDLLYENGVATVFRNARIDTTSTHGTGCTLSAAVTARLAKGSSMRDAVGLAIEYVHAAIESAPGLGRGHGPLNHWVL